MRFSIPALCLAASTIMLSCTQTDPIANPGVADPDENISLAPKLKIRKATAHDTVKNALYVAEFSYDALGRTSQFIYTAIDSSQSPLSYKIDTFKYFYEGDQPVPSRDSVTNVVISGLPQYIGTQKYIYESVIDSANRLTLLTLKDLHGSAFSQTKFTYTGTGAKLEGYYKSGSNWVLSYSHPVNYYRGNIYKAQTCWNGICGAGGYTATFDHKRNAFEAYNILYQRLVAIGIPIFPWGAASKNNVLFQAVNEPNPFDNEYFDYRYTYNANGYPSTATMQESTGGFSTDNRFFLITYTYY